MGGKSICIVSGGWISTEDYIFTQIKVCQITGHQGNFQMKYLFSLGFTENNLH